MTRRSCRILGRQETIVSYTAWNFNFYLFTVSCRVCWRFPQSVTHCPSRYPSRMLSDNRADDTVNLKRGQVERSGLGANVSILVSPKPAFDLRQDWGRSLHISGIDNRQSHVDFSTSPADEPYRTAGEGSCAFQGSRASTQRRTRVCCYRHCFTVSTHPRERPFRPFRSCFFRKEVGFPRLEVRSVL
jgi:hypothetical protein